MPLCTLSMLRSTKLSRRVGIVCSWWERSMSAYLCFHPSQPCSCRTLPLLPRIDHSPHNLPLHTEQVPLHVVPVHVRSLLGRVEALPWRVQPPPGCRHPHPRQLLGVVVFLEEELGPSVGWGVGMALVEALTLAEGGLACWQLMVGSDCLSFRCFASNLSHEAPRRWRGTSLAPPVPHWLRHDTWSWERFGGQKI